MWLEPPFAAYSYYNKIFKLRKLRTYVMELDNWQTNVLTTEGNISVCSGRQVGKSTVVSIKAGEFAANNANKSIMVIASVERQAYLLLEKILDYLEKNHKSKIHKGLKKPTKHKIQLKNGSVIHCLPTGLTGYGIRGFTIDLLIADEAAFIPEEVWVAVTPMLAITRGTLILLSTPHGTGTFFHRSFLPNSGFSTFHVSAEDCPRKDQEFLDRERARMTRLHYAQEYLGHFVEGLKQVFPDELIKKCMIVDRPKIKRTHREYFLGVDVAGMGKDDSTFEIIDRTNKNILIHVESIVRSELLTTETTRQILTLDSIYDRIKKIYIDDMGVGFGVFSELLSNDDTKRRVEAINNSSRPLEHDPETKKHKKILKNDLYNNLLNLMEQSKIQLLNDDEVFQSLKSVQFELTDQGMVKIFGNNTHIAEGLIRAAWCTKDKTLNIYCY